MWITCGKVVHNTGKLSTIRGYPHSLSVKVGKSKNFPSYLLIHSFRLSKNDLFYTRFVDSFGMKMIM